MPTDVVNPPSPINAPRSSTPSPPPSPTTPTSTTTSSATTAATTTNTPIPTPRAIAAALRLAPPLLVSSLVVTILFLRDLTRLLRSPTITALVVDHAPIALATDLLFIHSLIATLTLLLLRLPCFLRQSLLLPHSSNPPPTPADKPTTATPSEIPLPTAKQKQEEQVSSSSNPPSTTSILPTPLRPHHLLPGLLHTAHTLALSTSYLTVGVTPTLSIRLLLPLLPLTVLPSQTPHLPRLLTLLLHAIPLLTLSRPATALSLPAAIPALLAAILHPFRTLSLTHSLPRLVTTTTNTPHRLRPRTTIPTLKPSTSLPDITITNDNSNNNTSPFSLIIISTLPIATLLLLLRLLLHPVYPPLPIIPSLLRNATLHTLTLITTLHALPHLTPLPHTLFDAAVTTTTLTLFLPLTDPHFTTSSLPPTITAAIQSTAFVLVTPSRFLAALSAIASVTALLLVTVASPSPQLVSSLSFRKGSNGGSRHAGVNVGGSAPFSRQMGVGNVQGGRRGALQVVDILIASFTETRRLLLALTAAIPRRRRRILARLAIALATLLTLLLTHDVAQTIFHSTASDNTIPADRHHASTPRRRSLLPTSLLRHPNEEEGREGEGVAGVLRKHDGVPRVDDGRHSMSSEWRVGKGVAGMEVRRRLPIAVQLAVGDRDRSLAAAAAQRGKHLHGHHGLGSLSLGDRMRTAVGPVNLVLNQYYESKLSILSYADQGKLARWNLGDLIWKYAVHRGVVNYPKDRSVHACAASEEAEDCLKAVHDRFGDVVDMLVHAPLDMAIGKGFDGVVRNIARYAAEPYVRRVIVNGIGVRADFGREETEEGLKADDSGEKFVKGFVLGEEMKVALGNLTSEKVVLMVHGEYTRALLESMGVTKNVMVTGGNTLFLSKEVKLGERLQVKYDAMSKRVGDFTLRVAVNVKAFRGYFWMLTALSEKYPRADFIAQAGFDLKGLQQSKVPFSRVRIFNTTQRWLEGLEGYDVAIGGRIHGVMAALAAEVPVLLVAVDYGAVEIARTLRVPFISVLHEMFEKKKGMDVAALVKEVGFDGRKFDENRCRMAKKVVDVYRGVRANVRKHVADVAYGEC